MLVNDMVVEPSDCGFTTAVEQRRLLTPSQLRRSDDRHRHSMRVGVARHIDAGHEAAAPYASPRSLILSTMHMVVRDRDRGRSGRSAVACTSLLVPVTAHRDGYVA